MIKTRVGAALFVAIADIFIGFAALILVLIVISSSDEDPRAWRTIDIVASCEAMGSETWALTVPGQSPQSITESTDAFASTGLIRRLGLLVERDEMACYQAVDTAIRAHNRELLQRGPSGASLSLYFLPDMGTASP